MTAAPKTPPSETASEPRNRAFALTILANAAIMGCGAAGSILAARLLGPEGRGELAAIFVWVALVGAAGDLGLSQSCIYYGAKSDSPVSVAGTALSLGIGSALVAIGCILPFWKNIFATTIPGTWLYLFSIPLTVTATYLAAILQGTHRLNAFNLVRVLQAAVYPVGIIVAWVITSVDLRTVLSMVLLCQSGATIITLAIATRTIPLAQWRFHSPLAKQMYSYGLRCYSGNLFWLANGRLDQALLTFLAPMRDLGMYAVAVSYSGILFGLSGALATVVFPRVAQAESTAAGKREILHTIRMLIAFAVPLAILMGVGARWAVPAAFGHAFNNAVGPSNILLFGGVILGVNYVLSNGLRASGRPGAPAIGEAAGLLVTVAGLPLALPRWGILGAAWVSVASYAITAGTLVWLTTRKPAVELAEVN